MKNTALIVVDMVYDFAHPQGAVFYQQNEEILPRIKKVIDVCRDKDLLIIFMQHYHRQGKFDKALLKGRQNCIEGTGGDEIMPQLEVNSEKDFVIRKRRYSSFYGTDLDLVLREHNIKNVVFVGTKTNCCIRASVHDAYNLDYNTYVIRECVATNDDIVNEVHLTDIHKYFGTVLTMEEFFNKLREEGINE